MSRHRNIRNLDINDELNDDALSDGGEQDMTTEQEVTLNNALDQVKQVIGGEDASGLSDKSIKDVLWDYYYDVEKTVLWALEEKERMLAAKERKGACSTSQASTSGLIECDCILTGRITEVYVTYPSHPGVQGFVCWGDNPLGDVQAVQEIQERPRVPLIMLNQQQQYNDGFEDQLMVPDGLDGRRLSTITERTERTEPSPYWRPYQQLAPPESPIPATSSPATSYGQLIEHDEFVRLDPNSIPISPSDSAQKRLSLYDAPPSKTSTDSRSSSATPPQSTPRADMLPKSLPDIPDNASQTSQQTPIPIPPPTSQTPKKSKLSMLASIRSARSDSSKSSRSSGTALTGSIKTFPALRPSAQSERLPSSLSSPSVASTKSLPPVPRDSSASSTSSHVRRAIEVAMKLEAEEQAATPKPLVIKLSDRSHPSGGKTPVSPKPKELASLKVSSKFTTSAEPASARPLSKLALLAQNKADLSKAPRLPKTTTEYLTPIANGSSVTTAITTSYQSLYSLTDPSRPPIIPKLDVVPLQSSPSSNTKQSKLAMKISKAKRQNMDPPNSEEVISPPVSPMFYPKPTHARASPSEFASILINDPLWRSEDRAEDKGSCKQKERHLKEDVDDESTVSGRNPLSEDSTNSHKNRSRRPKPVRPPVPDISTSSAFGFDSPSPDDLVFKAPAREREKAEKLARLSASSTRASTPIGTPFKSAKKSSSIKVSGTSTPIRMLDQKQLDISGLNLSSTEEKVLVEETPKMSFAKEMLLEEAKHAIEAQEREGKKGVSIVVIGHVDAGKSTLMGRLLYELNKMDEKTRRANEKGSSQAGKSSFSWAWGLDGTAEERERGITMDIALQTLATSHRQITILDAPGHKDFVPNMISGAAQADCALLVIDAATGEFEAGFDRGGQTREHLLLVRSLGVAQIIVAVNKLDMVAWEQSRYEEICSALKPFLIQSGFHPSKTQFLPVGAMQAVNIVAREGDDSKALNSWYFGPPLVDLLDNLEPPIRDITAPLRIPISNVFRTQGGIAVSGRLCGGVVQVGEQLRVLPGDESAVVKTIETEDSPVPWAAAGSNVTLSLTGIESLNIGIGSVLCPLTDLVPLAMVFTARIIVFDIQVPITAGTSVELFHHSRDVPATTSALHSTLDRATGNILKLKPRFISKGASADIQITLRPPRIGGLSLARGIPLEPFSVNKDMGRVLIRRGGETIAAGIVLQIIN